MAQMWPLFDLQVVTPRLVLRYVSDELGAELATLAAKGIHDPATMPFTEPWTDVPSPDLERNSLQYYWRNRAETSVQRWNLDLAVLADGSVVGMCSVHAEDFPRNRSLTTGSWLGLAQQGRGFGKELRQAALHLIFAGFDADVAITRAWHDNAASLGVTRSLPYTETVRTVEDRRGRPDTMVGFAMTPGRWATIRRDDIRLVGIDAVREQLGTQR
ncbi:GNAT family N-acetyltransferase [Mycolicibacterium aichiense]|uniref:Succinyl-CoA transferase n=1 Tax=Mycolicibacterium aichiense TaxID=1799 RepID=A0AAD1M9N5_9MYCO|nr:GNAT family protein [Mycolicibacterium aichiense]MCV7019137.1 GNAT family N-acetyltransferase [Mycolicibacterium aichiense]BBX06287.1 putative succinyl-CoA transferase [Mycolicibacterium aichiense]STZ24371.1 Putative Gcn5-related N-acetyltransferase [Mycolicibacterium aichiense]